MEPDRNILFLCADQLRFDCVGFSDRSKLRTPNLDRIARGSVFTRCQTANPICQPARSALLTGKYCHQIGALSMSGDLDFRHPTYPQALRSAGYWTAGIGKFHYLQSWPWSAKRGEGVDLTALREEMVGLGYDRVWETAGKQLAVKNYCDFCAYLDERGLLEAYRDAMEARGANRPVPGPELAKDGDPWPFAEEDHVDSVTGRKIREAIRERPKERPFFVFGSFCGPHKPFDPPARFLDAVPPEEEDDFLPGDRPLSAEDKRNLWKLRRAYKATVLHVDEEIGRILDLLDEEGLAGNTLVVFTSDHGELMGDHARVQKALFWRESLEVPLAIRHPGHLRGERFARPVELTDVTATILDFAGIDPTAALSRPFPDYNDRVPCRSLVPCLAGETDGVREFAFAECRAWKAVVSDDYKFVRQATEDPDQPSEWLFDTRSDPGEQNNLAADPAFRSVADWHRNRLFHVVETTPPAQLRWAPTLGEDPSAQKP